MKIQILTPHDALKLVEWYSKAFNTPEVSRFLALSMTREIPTVVDPDWVTMYLMDESGQGIAKLSPARSYNNQYCDLSVWVLPCDAKKNIAGALLHRAFQEARQRFGCKYMEWGVSGSNVDSLAFSNRRAQQWAYKPDGAWDPMLGRWVEMFYFRLNLEVYFNGRTKNHADQKHLIPELAVDT